MDEPGFTPERILALAGTGALLIVLLVIVIMLAGGGGDDEEPVIARTPERTATPTPTPTATPRPTPTPFPLTAEQRAARDGVVQFLRSAGVEAVNLKTWRPDATFQVLLGRPAGNPQGGRRAFFFVGQRQVGSDSPEYSRSLAVTKVGKSRVTLRYRLVDPSETVTVRVEWDGQALQYLDQIPPVERRRVG